MMHTLLTTTLAAAAAAALALGAPPSPSPNRGKPVLRLRAAAVDPGAFTPDGTRAAGAGLLEIGIVRWTTDAEHTRIVDELRENGPEGLLDDLQELPRAGYIRTPGTLAWDIHYARQIPLAGGGRRIVFATDRPMNFWELWNRPRSAEYQFLFAEVRVGPDGRGQGTLVPAARIDFDEETRGVQVENYASQPVRLTDVRVEE